MHDVFPETPSLLHYPCDNVELFLATTTHATHGTHGT